MTRGSQGRPSTARRLAGAVVGLGVLALVAVPAFWTAVFAHAGFTGCFMGCSTPQPWIGALWAGVSLLLLILPVAAGFVTARVRSRWGWVLAVLIAVVLLIAWILGQRVI